jgi:hypothetical protein
MFKLNPNPNIQEISKYLDPKVAESFVKILPPMWGQRKICEAMATLDGSQFIAANIMESLGVKSGFLDLSYTMALVATIGGFLTQHGEITSEGNRLSRILLQPDDLEIGNIIRNPKILERAHLFNRSRLAALVVLELVIYN